MLAAKGLNKLNYQRLKRSKLRKDTYALRSKQQSTSLVSKSKSIRRTFICGILDLVFIRNHLLAILTPVKAFSVQKEKVGRIPVQISCILTLDPINHRLITIILNDTVQLAFLKVTLLRSWNYLTFKINRISNHKYKEAMILKT